MAGLKRSQTGWNPETRQALSRQGTTVTEAAPKQQRLCLQQHRSPQHCLINEIKISLQHLISSILSDKIKHLQMECF